MRANRRSNPRGSTSSLYSKNNTSNSNQQFKDRSRKQNYKSVPVSSTQQEPCHNKCSVCTSGLPNYKCPHCRSIYCSIACCRKHKLELCTCTIQPETLQHADNQKVVTGTNMTNVESSLSTTTSIIATDPNMTSQGTPNPILPIMVPKSKYLSHAMLQHALVSTSQQKPREKQKQDNTTNNNDEPPGWTITDEMRQKLRTSTWLQRELTDIGLQHIIDRIVGMNQQHQQQNVFEEELDSTNPAFAIFVDKLLVIAGVLQAKQQQWSNEKNMLKENENNLEKWLTQNHNPGRHHLELVPVPSSRDQNRKRKLLEATSDSLLQLDPHDNDDDDDISTDNSSEEEEDASIDSDSSNNNSDNDE